MSRSHNSICGKVPLPRTISSDPHGQFALIRAAIFREHGRDSKLAWATACTKTLCLFLLVYTRQASDRNSLHQKLLKSGTSNVIITFWILIFFSLTKTLLSINKKRFTMAVFPRIRREEALSWGVNCHGVASVVYSPLQHYGRQNRQPSSMQVCDVTNAVHRTDFCEAWQSQWFVSSIKSNSSHDHTDIHLNFCLQKQDRSPGVFNRRLIINRHNRRLIKRRQRLCMWYSRNGADEHSERNVGRDVSQCVGLSSGIPSLETASKAKMPLTCIP